MKHRTNAYKDNFKWIIFCTVCGVEEPVLEINGECSGEFVTRKPIQGELSPFNLSIGEAIEKGKDFFEKPIVVGNSQNHKN